jgi:hypothetical protein
MYFNLKVLVQIFLNKYKKKKKALIGLLPINFKISLINALPKMGLK